MARPWDEVPLFRKIQLNFFLFLFLSCKRELLRNLILCRQAGRRNAFLTRHFVRSGHVLAARRKMELTEPNQLRMQADIHSGANGAIPVQEEFKGIRVAKSKCRWRVRHLECRLPNDELPGISSSVGSHVCGLHEPSSQPYIFLRQQTSGIVHKSQDPVPYSVVTWRIFSSN